jgi:hypothetical protein
MHPDWGAKYFHFESRALPVDWLLRGSRANWPIRREFKSLSRIPGETEPSTAAAPSAFKPDFLSFSSKPCAVG